MVVQALSRLTWGLLLGRTLGRYSPGGTFPKYLLVGSTYEWGGTLLENLWKGALGRYSLEIFFLGTRWSNKRRYSWVVQFVGWLLCLVGWFQDALWVNFREVESTLGRYSLGRYTPQIETRSLPLCSELIGHGPLLGGKRNTKH